MPGYGSSTARHVVSDYSLESLVSGMSALLSATGRSAGIWVGHDWGAGVTSAFATQHPSAVKALINIAIPHRSIELGWAGFLPQISREIYPDAVQYEFGQWDYMKNYEENFEKTVKWYDSDVAGFCKALYQKTSPPASRVAPTATVRRDGGRLGGAPRPPTVEEVKGEPFLPPEVFESFSMDMQKTGFWPASAYYLNHERNAEYNGKAPSGGRLTQPVLFVHAAWDTICDTKASRLAEPMREVCSNLTEVTIEVGHFAMMERPVETNAALARFIVEELPSEWPGFWDSGYTKKKTAM